MPDTDENAVVEDSVIKEQSTTIKTLTEELQKGSTQPPQILYEPKVAKEASPNYVMIALVIVAVYMLFFSKRRR